MNRKGLIAKISIKYVLPTCIWKYFLRISRYFAFFGEFRGISRECLNFAGPRPREISEALYITWKDTAVCNGGTLARLLNFDVLVKEVGRQFTLSSFVLSPVKVKI